MSLGQTFSSAHLSHRTGLTTIVALTMRSWQSQPTSTVGCAGLTRE